MQTSSRNKTCRNCGNAFYGRLNQDYCSNKCRFDFNNQKAREETREINSILKILLKNREILKTLVETGKPEILKSELQTRGYNSIYHTHHLKAENNLTYIFCFEYGFIIVNDTLKLTKLDENL